MKATSQVIRVRSDVVEQMLRNQQDKQ